MLLSVVIPVFNEEHAIRPLLDRLWRLAEGLGGDALEVIFVDDHSTDGSPGLLKEGCAKDPRFRYVRLSANCGSHVAILAGLEHARGDCAVFLASDLQDPPELISEMLHLWRQGSHIVWAVRSQREGVSAVERWLSRLFYKLVYRLGNVRLPPEGSDFALLDRKVVDALRQSAGATLSLGGEIARSGFRQAEVPYVKARRAFGASKWSLERKLRTFVDAFVSFSYMPLRAMSYVGIVCSIVGFFYALVVIVSRLLTRTPIEGWASLMVVVLLIGGIQMVMLGVLGEYLWRTLEEARRRPLYSIEESFQVGEAGRRERS